MDSPRHDNKVSLLPSIIVLTEEVVFTLLPSSKISIYSLQNYFGDAWNVFDFIIVLGSFIDIIYDRLHVSIMRL